MYKYPEFCPNPHCALHLPNHVKDYQWYTAAGSYMTKAFGKVKRFYCTHCGKYFSEQSFSIDYYAKRTLSYPTLFEMVFTTSSVRDMARAFHVKKDTILNKLSRLARNAIIALNIIYEEVHLQEDMVADGFETFTVSQYFPAVINLLVGKKSQMVYWFDYVTIKRKGRMTEEQKRTREALEKLFRAPKNGVFQSFFSLSDHMARLICHGKQKSIGFYTDEHPTYTRVLQTSLAMKVLFFQERITHIQVPSTKPRTVSNHLFSVNYIDRQLRKDISSCVRETVCFARNVCRSMDRLIIYFLYHNLYKPYREQQGDFRSHAEVAGVSEKKVEDSKKRIFTKRAFLSHTNLSGPLLHAWKRLFITPLKENREYLPRYAYAS
jgi:hypothetical protein